MLNQTNNKPKKSCIYLNVFYNPFEVNSAPADILTDARNKYFSTGCRRIKDKISFSVNGCSYSYIYQIQPNGKFKWRAVTNGVITEDVITESSGYVIVCRNMNGIITKKIYFNHSHIWQKTEYFNSNIGVAASLMPWLNDDRAAIALYDGVASFPQILYVLSLPDSDSLLQEAVRRCSPVVRATVNNITYYFGDEELEEHWSSIINLQSKAVDNNSTSKAVEYFFLSNLTNTNLNYYDLTKTNVVFGEVSDIQVQESVVDTHTTDNIHIAHTPDEDMVEDEADSINAITNKDDFEVESPVVPTAPISPTALPLPPARVIRKKPGEPAASADKAIMLSPKEKGLYYGELDSDNNRSGYGRTVSSKGKTLYEGEYSNDMKNGFGVSYFKTGKVAHIGSYKDDKYNGVGIEFRATDGCMTVANYQNNSKELVQAKFDKQGNLIFAGNPFAKNGVGVSFNPENGEMFIPIVQNGDVQNRGTIISADGILLYSGDYKNGNKDGRGILFNNDGTVKYTGGFKRNVYSGNGTLKYENGSVYTGEFLNGVPNGIGELKDIHSKTVYSGQWKKGVYNGDGKLYSSNGNCCVGKFVNGEAKGRLSIYDKNNIIVYCGTVTDGKPDGSGICYENGVKIYDGQLSDGTRSGTGRLYNNGECVYMGTFENDMFNGFGISYSDGKQMYCGMWQNGKYHGAGVLSIDDITLMAGNFENGVPNGRVNIIKNSILVSECIYQNGDCEYMHEYSADGSGIIYDGNIKNNQREGMGCTFSDYGEKQFEGIFKDGKPSKSMKVSLRELNPLEYVAKLKDTDYEKFRHSKEFVVEQPMLGGVFSGQLSDGMPDGKGTILYVDHRYTGCYKNGIPCGNGIIYFGDGTVIKGSFSDKPLVNTTAIECANVTYYKLEQ